MGRVAATVLARVRTNRTKGARELALETLDGLDAELASWHAGATGEAHRAARAIARDLSRTQPAMALFAEWGQEWRAIAGPRPAGRLGERLRAWVRRSRRRLLLEPERIGRAVRAVLPAGVRIVTISRGATLAQALGSLPRRRRPREILVLESLPGGEGRRMARELRGWGLSARWVPDRSFRDAVRSSDLVLVGADTVEPDGSVVHKVGTRRLAAEAHRRGVPVVVVAGRSKWRRRGRAPHRLPALFDRTPPRLLSAYWTDAGALPGRSRSRPRRRHQREEGARPSATPPPRARRPDRRTRWTP